MEQGCCMGNQVLFPGAETSHFTSVPRFPRAFNSRRYSALRRHTCRGLESLKAIIRTAFQAPRQKELLHTHEPKTDLGGTFTTVSFKVRRLQKVNSSYLLEVTVVMGDLHPSHPTNESPSINSLPTQADHHPPFHSRMNYKNALSEEEKRKWSSAGELLCFAVTPSIIS